MTDILPEKAKELNMKAAEFLGHSYTEAELFDKRFNVITNWADLMAVVEEILCQPGDPILEFYKANSLFVVHGRDDTHWPEGFNHSAEPSVRLALIKCIADYLGVEL